jgi:membrane protease YdiL (CAAX protease family)
VWTGWDVLAILLLTLAAVVFFVAAITLALKWLVYPDAGFTNLMMRHPLIVVGAQTLAYFVVLTFMAVLVRYARGRPFWSAIRWNWPKKWWPYFAGGTALSMGLQLLARLLPIPKSLPIDEFFHTPAEAWALAVFGVTLAPLMEELFFRGFLYPVLARRLGVTAGVLLTSLGFALIHADQLGKAWAPVFVVFLVGVALTVVRAVTKSVAAGVLMHCAYNGTIFALMFVYTGGFRHLERLSQ